jgi:hypothetical protein
MLRERAMALRAGLARAGLALVLGMALFLSGCSLDPERKPIPVVSIHLLEADDGYTLNGQAMTMAQMKRELLETAQANPREKSGDCRAVVRIYLPPGVDYTRVTQLEEYCVSIGLDQIEKDY